MEPVQQSSLLTRYLICYLCQQAPLQPRLCPRCSKAFCHHCLLTSVNTLRSQCPSCSERLALEDFLQAQTVLSIVEQVAEKVRRQLKRNEQRQLCEEHELILNYFCVDCNAPLCGDCGLLTNRHQRHKIMSYRDIYQRVKNKVLEQFPRFDRKIKVLESKKGQLRASMQSLQDQYRRYKKYFEEAFLTYTEKLEREATTLQEKIAVREQNNSRRLQELEMLKDTIYEEMQTKTQITLIKQADSLIESISALAAQELPSIPKEPSFELEDLAQLVPQYGVWDFSLKEYSKKTGIVYSEEKNVNGVSWRLKIYPRGNGLARDKYISVFVEMTKGLTGQNKYEYKIQLLNDVYPELTIRREYCSTFEIGQCWGYNQFEPLDQLTSKEYIRGDTLTFRVGVRNRTYRSFAEQQQVYINRLQLQLEQKQKEMKAEEVQEKSMSVVRIKEFLLKESKKKE